jgi:hypothetical protein
MNQFWQKLGRNGEGGHEIQHEAQQAISLDGL